MSSKNPLNTPLLEKKVTMRENYWQALLLMKPKGMKEGQAIEQMIEVTCPGAIRRRVGIVRPVDLLRQPKESVLKTKR